MSQHAGGGKSGGARTGSPTQDMTDHIDSLDTAIAAEKELCANPTTSFWQKAASWFRQDSLRKAQNDQSREVAKRQVDKAVMDVGGDLLLRKTIDRSHLDTLKKALPAAAAAAFMGMACGKFNGANNRSMVPVSARQSMTDKVLRTLARQGVNPQPGLARLSTRVPGLSSDRSVLQMMRTQNPTTVYSNASGSLTIGGGARSALVAPVPHNARAYIREVEAKSGLTISQKQRTLLVNDLRETSYPRFERGSDALKEHKTYYDKPSTKREIKSDWERETGQVWPKYPAIDAKTGFQKVDDFGNLKFSDYQLHHIVPQNMGGRHRWWNSHPVHPNHHQGGVHGRGSELNAIEKAMK